MSVNRIARHLDPPAPPTDTRGRYELVSDAVLRAVAAVTRLLDDDDPAVVLKAAKMILDVEKTRMRHGREVHGAPDPYREETRQMLGPIWNNPNPVKPEHDDDFDEDYEDEPAIHPIPDRMSEGTGPPPAGEERDDETSDRDDPGDATTDEPSDFQQWLKGFYAERFPDVTTIPPHRPVGVGGRSAEEDSFPPTPLGGCSNGFWHFLASGGRQPPVPSRFPNRQGADAPRSPKTIAAPPSGECVGSRNSAC